MKIRAAAVSRRNSCMHLAGNEYLYGRYYGGNCVPDAVCNVMEQNGFSVSRKKPSGVGAYTHRSWDYVITL